MVNESSHIFYDDGDEPLDGEGKVVNEDQPPVYDTDEEEEQLPFDVYNNEDNPFFMFTTMCLV